MSTKLPGITQYEAWPKLQALADKHLHLKDLFTVNKQRSKQMTVKHDGLTFDYSKQLLTDEILKHLLALAEQADIAGQRDAMFAGERINTTEKRRVLHVALRNVSGSHVTYDGQDVGAEARAVLQNMQRFADAVRLGGVRGKTGKPLKNIVNIGIGGSSAGPQMAITALRQFTRQDMQYRFLSNIDPANFYDVTADLEPSETLFIINSKSFTTDETMANTAAARQWIANAMGDEAVENHFVAVSTNIEAVKKFGIHEDRIFGFWDWVGGRFSLDSASGLAILLAIGSDEFNNFLAGMHAVDEHFRTAPLAENIPVLMALVSQWNQLYFANETEAVIPYSSRLSRFSPYLQQLVMESNGKSRLKSGEPVHEHTSPVVWGEPGTDAQHTFFQLLHQGTRVVPVDFIGFTEADQPLGRQHNMLLGNMLAQARVLAFGRSKNQLRNEKTPKALIEHKVMRGNKPSSMLLAERLCPYSLGQLIALYEHKVFVNGALWGINSFDQFGVELGKIVARDVTKQLEDGVSIDEIRGKHA